VDEILNKLEEESKRLRRYRLALVVVGASGSLGFVAITWFGWFEHRGYLHVVVSIAAAVLGFSAASYEIRLARRSHQKIDVLARGLCDLFDANINLVAKFNYDYNHGKRKFGAIVWPGWFVWRHDKSYTPRMFKARGLPPPKRN